MNKNFEEKSLDNKPKWLAILLPFASTIVGGGALWYAWLRYNTILNRPDLYWYGWIPLVAMTLMGILCLLATILFILGKPFGWPIFKAGLSVLPLLLFSNLIILVLRLIQGIFQGNAQFFFDRLFTQPRNILILIVVIALILLNYLDRTIKNSE